MPAATRLAENFCGSGVPTLQQVRRHAQELDVAVVPDRQPLLLPSNMAQSLRHVVERRREARIHQFEFGGLFSDQLFAALLRGDVFCVVSHPPLDIGCRLIEITRPSATSWISVARLTLTLR